MNAFAMFVHEPSITAAPGSSIRPSLSRSRRLPPSFFQSTSSCSISAARWLGACEPLRSFASSGTVSIARTSWVAAAFIAEVTVASDHLPFFSSRFEVLVEQVDALGRARPAPLVVGGAEALRDDLVPVGHRPVLRVDAVRMAVLAQEPLPLVLAGALGGQAGVDAVGADRQLAGRVLGDVLVVDVEGVERLRSLRRGVEERLRIVDLAVRDPPVEEQVEDVLAVARALRRDRDLLAVDGRVPRDRAMDCGLERDRVAVRACRRRTSPCCGTCPCTCTSCRCHRRASPRTGR